MNPVSSQTIWLALLPSSRRGINGVTMPCIAIIAGIATRSWSLTWKTEWYLNFVWNRQNAHSRNHHWWFQGHSYSKLIHPSIILFSEVIQQDSNVSFFLILNIFWWNHLQSYAKRTVIDGFDPMFNAITGLNGSGKSNILDSICFVLGISRLEQVWDIFRFSYFVIISSSK